MANDLTVAIERLIASSQRPWTVADFADHPENATEIDSDIATILNAVVSGGLVRSDLCVSGQVRALEWKDSYGIFDDDDEVTYSEAEGAGYIYIAEAVDCTMEEAKAARQAEFERRILAALTPAPQPENCPHEAWEEDTAGQPVKCADCGESLCSSSPATQTAQETVPAEDELDEAWKDGFNAGFGEAKLTASAALEAYGREKVREGMQRAAEICEDYSTADMLCPAEGWTPTETSWWETGGMDHLDAARDAILDEMEKLK